MEKSNSRKTEKIDWTGSYFWFQKPIDACYIVSSYTDSDLRNKIKKKNINVTKYLLTHAIRCLFTFPFLEKGAANMVTVLLVLFAKDFYLLYK